MTDSNYLSIGQFGYFDPETLDFVINDVATPKPWVNVLANELYGAIVSQAGGGFSWYKNCQLFRLNRWEQDLSSDCMGRFVYVQDLEKPDELWSTTYQPTRKRANVERVRHGLGYTVFERSFGSLHTRHAIFVPHDAPCEVWIVQVSNDDRLPRRVRLAVFLEWHLGGIGDWHREYHRLFVETRARQNVLLARKHPGLAHGSRELVNGSITSFLSLRGAGAIVWVTDKRNFLGPRGDLSAPALLVAGCDDAVYSWSAAEDLTFSQQGSGEETIGTGRWDDPVGCGIVEFELEAGATSELIVILGATESEAEVESLSASYDQNTASLALDTTRSRWRERCGEACVYTPETALNIMCNGWLPYQAICGRMLARCGYYQQSGAFGYRDQLQDSLVNLLSRPKETWQQIRLHAEAMYEDGSVRHWWHPNTNIFAESRHSDAALWLPYAVAAYLEETANLEALWEEATFLDRETQIPSQRRSILEHCLRAINRSLDDLTARGLPRIRSGDWNDGLSHAGIDGKGESVWLGMFLYHLLQKWGPNLERIGRDSEARELLAAAEQLRMAINSHGWDGEWYVAGFRDDGRPFGSKECEEGKIFLMPQAWAVISGIAPPDRAEICTNAVRERLVRPYGVLLLTPAYSRLDPFIGYITRYAPGVRENGGVYCHAATWAVQALAMVGDTDGALSLYRSICPPCSSSNNPELYAAEPYVMPGNVDGPESPYEGRASWTWYTGSAAWMKRVAFDWLCGVRAEYEGLRLRPIVPSAWSGFRMRRPFRGDVFEIEVHAAEPRVAGSAAADLLFQSTGSGKVHTVRVP